MARDGGKREIKGNEVLDPERHPDSPSPLHCCRAASPQSEALDGEDPELLMAIRMSLLEATTRQEAGAEDEEEHESTRAPSEDQQGRGGEEELRRE